MKYPEHLDPMLAAEDSSLQLARLAIDQLVVDGMVKRGGTSRAYLHQAAFHLVDVGKAVLQEFDEAVNAEPRCRYPSRNYVKLTRAVSAGAAVRPRPKALLAGTADCSDEEYQGIVDRMEVYAQAVLDTKLAKTQAISYKDTDAMLEAAGFEVDFPEVSAFIYYMYTDSRFAAQNGNIPPRRQPAAMPDATFDTPRPERLFAGRSDKTTLDKRIHAALGPASSYRRKR